MHSQDTMVKGLKEIKNVRQISGEGFRRWFTDDFFDLYIWYQDNKKDITGFQLAYGEVERDHALTWTVNHGFSHDGVDDGNITGSYKRSPILIANGMFDPDSLIHMFEEHQGDLDKKLFSFIKTKIKGYRKN